MQLRLQASKAEDPENHAMKRSTRGPSALRKAIENACINKALFPKLRKDLEETTNAPDLWTKSDRFDIAEINSLKAEDMNKILHANSKDISLMIWWFKFLTTAPLAVRSDNYTLPIIINAHLHKKDITGAIRWIDLIHKGSNDGQGSKDAMSVAANSILREYGRTGKTYEMERWWRTMTHVYKVEPNVRAITIAINAYGRNKDLRNALRWFKTLSESFGIKPDYEAYCAIIDAHAEAGNFQGASKYLDEMRTAGIDPDRKVYNILMHAAKTGRYWHEADTLFKTMLLEGITPDLYTHSALINCHGVCGNRKMALECFDNLVSAGFKPDPTSLTGVLNAIAGEGDVEACVSWLARIENEFGAKINTIYINILLKALYRSQMPNKHELALQFWTRYLDSGLVAYSNQTYHYLILSCKTGNEEESIKMTEFWFNHMLCSKPRIEPQPSTLELVRKILGKERFEKKLEQLINEPQVLYSVEDLERDIAR